MYKYLARYEQMLTGGGIGKVPQQRSRENMQMEKQELDYQKNISFREYCQVFPSYCILYPWLRFPPLLSLFLFALFHLEFESSK